MNNKSIFQANKKIGIVANVILIVCSLVVIYPIVFMIFTSLKTNEEFYKNIFGFPTVLHFENYKTAWVVGKMGKYFGNSVLVTSASVLLTTLVSMMGGYALAKMFIPKSETIIMAFMTFTFIPGIAIYISLYSMMTRMQMTGNYFTMILPYTAWQIPFSMYIFKKFFETVPSELIESARIDGASELRLFANIILPLVKPAIATVVVFNFINNWGELMWANIVCSASVNTRTLPVALLNFKTEMGVEWGQYAAGICMVTIPLMMVFTYFQKYFIAGLTNGAVKG